MLDLSGIKPVLKREIKSYFTSPLAYIFLVLFLVMQGVFTFYLGSFFARGQADLTSFFAYQPWLFLFFMPAISMRLWAEERRGGTLELLLTLPIAPMGAILGKYLAALLFCLIAIALTFPIWITVNYLGDPDNGVIVMGYIGAFFLAASYLAIGLAMSVFTANQVIAFILSITLCFLFAVTGMPIVLDSISALGSDALTLAFAGLSILTHFNEIQSGVLTVPALIYFLSLIFFWIGVCAVGLSRSREAG